MGIKVFTDQVPAPFGNGTVSMETVECDGFDEDCIEECTGAVRCSICGEVYCKDQDDHCCDEEEDDVELIVDEEELDTMTKELYDHCVELKRCRVCKHYDLDLRQSVQRLYG